jgi:hypothetical protein
MSRRLGWFLLGSVALVTLAGCGKGFWSYAEREPWRREAEVACLKSGTVRENASLVRIEPISGPGMCGADFPLKVSALGESSAYGYSDEPLRPPGAIPGGPRAAEPRWPIQQQPIGAPQSYWQRPYPPPGAGGEPMSIHAPGTESSGSGPDGYPQQQLGAPPAYLQAPRDWQRVSPGGPPIRRAAPPAKAVDDIEELPPYAQPGGTPGRPIPTPAERPLPRLGPDRGPAVVNASMPVEVRPTATLACPIVSALDQWIAASVQPSARKWFGQPVVEIKQISAYSCRGMNGQPGASISEHAFGNALDIAAFVLADGRRVTVKDGWRGAPEEQGFLRDVQAAACDQFTTVLAPGSNQFHYDHIHVDLMRRVSGRRICQPGAVDGEQVAARARQSPRYAAQSFEPPPTRRYDPPPYDRRDDPFAWRGDARRGDVTGSVVARRPSVNPAAEDNDWVEEPGPRPAIDWSSDRHKVR